MRDCLLQDDEEDDIGEAGSNRKQRQYGDQRGNPPRGWQERDGGQQQNAHAHEQSRGKDGFHRIGIALAPPFCDERAQQQGHGWQR